MQRVQAFVSTPARVVQILMDFKDMNSQVQLWYILVWVCHQCFVRGWGRRTKKDYKEIKGTTKPLMAILHGHLSFQEENNNVFMQSWNSVKCPD